MTKPAHPLTIGTLAEQAGVNAETIRFYQRRGLVPEPTRKQAEKKLAGVRAKRADLERIERALVDLVERCSAARGKVRCPLIAALREA